MRAPDPPVPPSRRGGFPARGGVTPPLSSCAAEDDAPPDVAILRLRKNYENGRPGGVSRETVRFSGCVLPRARIHTLIYPQGLRVPMTREEMHRTNVLLPNDLVERAREVKLNVSQVCRDALRAELEGLAYPKWKTIEALRKLLGYRLRSESDLRKAEADVHLADRLLEGWEKRLKEILPPGAALPELKPLDPLL